MSKKEENTMLGERIRDLRKKFGYSQQQLANKMHLTQGAISQWENNITVPAADQLLSLSQVFGITVDELLKQEEIVSQNPWDVEAAFSDPDYESIRIMARGMKKMSPENRQKLLDVAMTLFEQDFDEQGNKKK
jgi:transcriptional regulator with XRE-family HTH domain